ncbi:lysosomal alpha-mannosidase-like isoform X1 [Achroia grisella]|uniref:lysosomal alpha-mannosidase-like isoform X1 n=1 Tax=Achroia grisella TaxID=688607 RepID=UPI0027D22297|nr:lysosomal alpha-mannosidase-like isoform X1 [Achroia grisella]
MCWNILGVPHGHDWNTPRPGEKCGYESCTKAKEGFLNVHIVPHTHDDVGWLKTVDQYYYGSRNDIQKAGVQYILDSVIKELWENSNRRFIYVETAFFWKWWTQQSDAVQRKVHALVRQGRLEFVGGAWSMNDEAAAHYQSIIDQFTWGLKKLNDTFGSCALPRVGWQIDPFGHSRELASLLAAMGYDGLFLGRLDYQDKRARLAEKRMEMLWRGDDDLGKTSDIFTGALYNTYSPPPGFCFDVLCNDEPIVDDVNSPMYNVDKRVSEFLSYVETQSQRYRTNNVILTMGGDFTYQDASMWYINLDKLIEYTNLKAAKENLNVTLFYSTPNCYLKAVKDADPVLPTKQDDFFPYASDPNAYWTGYFSSRPTTKYFEREGNNYLQMVKQLQVLADLPDHNLPVLDELRSAMGVMQHHDAVTGTEKEHVTHDYERLLDQAIEDALIIARQAFNKVAQGDALKPTVLSYDRCRLNETSCSASENSNQFVVTVYNPLAFAVDETIGVPVRDGEYSVYDSEGTVLKSQLLDITSAVLNIPTRRSKATHELFFIAKLEALSINSYYIKKTSKKAKRQTGNNKKMDDINEYNANINNYWRNVKDKIEIDMRSLEKQDVDNTNKKMVPDIPATMNREDKFVNRGNIDINVLKDKGERANQDVEEFEKLLEEENRRIETTRRIRAGFDKSYPNLNGEEMRMLSDDPMIVEQYEDNEVSIQKNGIHIAADNNGERITIQNRDLSFDLSFFYYPGCYGDNREFINRSSGAYIFRPNATEAIELETINRSKVDGDIVSEIRTTRTHNVNSVIRIYETSTYIDHYFVIGPIPIEDGIGKEYVSRYTSNLRNTGGFYTDSNGRQIIKRKINNRPQWNLTIEEPIAGNYYPVTNFIAIQSEDNILSVVTDRSRGGTSLKDGEIELMLHRRLLHDDAFGVGEALNETANGIGLVVRGYQRIYPVQPEGKLMNVKALKNHLHPIVFVSNADNLDINDWYKLRNKYTWAQRSVDGVHLLTLEPWNENLLLRLENINAFKKSVKVDLNSILKNIKIKRIKETTLAGNQWLNDNHKWEWRKEGKFVKSFNDAYGNAGYDVKADDDDDDDTDEKGLIVIKPRQIRTFIVEYDYVN